MKQLLVYLVEDGRDFQEEETDRKQLIDKVQQLQSTLNGNTLPSFKCQAIVNYLTINN